MSYQNQKNNLPENSEQDASLSLTSPDKTLWLVVVFLIVFGIASVFSATAPKAIDEGLNPASYVLKQLVLLAAGIVGLKMLSNYNYQNLKKWAIPFSWFIIFCLILVDFTPLGVQVNGAKRWINIFGLFQFQPSELAKLGVTLLLANAFHKDFKIFTMEKFQNAYIPILLMIFLIFAQPNLSMIILLALTSIAIYFAAGGSLKMFFIFGSIGGLALCTFIKPYQLSRIQIWLRPEADPYGAGYNIIQSLVAFAAGGFCGVGYGNAKQKLAWLPEGHTDFIFAVIAEEWGFTGCVLLICVFWILIYKGFRIASRCSDNFGKLLAIGITFSIGCQAFINMSVASSFIPATGVPLPFISYGGTSLFVSLCMIGILLNISKKKIKRVKIYERKNFT